MKDTYTKALLDLLATTNDVEQVLRGFARTLDARGHMALQAPVLKAVLRTLEAERPQTVVTVKNNEQHTKQQAAIEKALVALGASKEPVVTYDETLIGGYIAEHNHQRIDASFKTKLVSLYRSITN